MPPKEAHVDIVILGAGPTGLGAAWRIASASGASVRFALIDEGGGPGGRATSHTTPEGFTFDHGGHVFFPHAEYSAYISLVLELVPAWHESVPARGVWIDGRLIPTPVQRNIHRLPLMQFASSLWGLWKLKQGLSRGAKNGHGARETNLLEYLEAQFGPQLTRHVMRPLNQKMWSHAPENLCSSWATFRSGSKEKNIPEVVIGNVLRNFVLRQDEPGWTNATRVRYPREGGVGAIWDALYSRLPRARCHMGVRALSIDPRKKRISLSNGSVFGYEKLITSIPLDSLLTLLTEEPELSAQASRFKRTAVQINGFGIEGNIPSQLEGVHAFNVPSLQIPFWRVNFPGNFSPGNVPPNTWSVLCEASFSGESVAKILTGEDTERHLRRMNVIPQNARILSTWSRHLTHGYPVPFAGRDRLLAEIQPRLEALDIYSRGRFGGWKYEVSNQDHAFMQGMEVVDRILSGQPEKTYIHSPAAG
jgi:protoporphyrinogen oxidase